jgi:hypothetical protein
MMRLRMFMGLTSALQGFGGLKFEDYDVGVGYLVNHSEDGWQFSAALIFGGLVMLWAAAREWFGERRRRCRIVSAFLLAVTWIAVFFHSLEGGAEPVTLIAPVYVFFCFWSWHGEATVERRRLTGEAGT